MPRSTSTSWGGRTWRWTGGRTTCRRSRHASGPTSFWSASTQQTPPRPHCELRLQPAGALPRRACEFGGLAGPRLVCGHTPGLRAAPGLALPACCSSLTRATPPYWSHVKLSSAASLRRGEVYLPALLDVVSPTFHLPPTCTAGRRLRSGSASRSTSCVTGAVSPSPNRR